MSKIYIIPDKDMTIPHPDIDGPITPEGAWVPNDKFYRGFVNRKEAAIGKPPKEKTSSPKKQTLK